MIKKINLKFLFRISLFSTFLFAVQFGLFAKSPAAKVIPFDTSNVKYQELLSGSKDTAAFYSGLVTIEPGKSGEAHSTEKYEEMIIVFSGKGEVRIKDNQNLAICFGKAAYVPPQTGHQVFNTGTVNLKYIYVATKSKK